MKKLQELLGKRFRVYEDSQFSCYCDFLGVMKRLANFSDFFGYSKKEQNETIEQWIKDGYIYVDSNIRIRFGGKA